MVHPWMSGIVTVQAAGAEPMLAATMELDQIMAEFQTSDGVANNAMTIDLTLTDLDGNGIEHITYYIKATQGSDVLLDEEGHMHKGILSNTHTTDVLSVDASESMPVVIAIESVGFGHDEQYVAVTGEIATKQVVPEFGTIAAMILAVAIISIIAISAKSKLSIMPRL
jgi:predicted secreted protein with PEFG-CTERM motif